MSKTEDPEAQLLDRLEISDSLAEEDDVVCTLSGEESALYDLKTEGESIDSKWIYDLPKDATSGDIDTKFRRQLQRSAPTIGIKEDA